MTCTPSERAFLSFLAMQPKGRAGYDLQHYDQAEALAGDLVERGLIKPRRLKVAGQPLRDGYQLTAQGRAALMGMAD